MHLNLIMGAQNDAKTNREEYDFYATHPNTTQDFLTRIKQDGIQIKGKVWECCCGKGHMSDVLQKNGYDVFSSDLIDRGYTEQYATGDILNSNFKPLTLPTDYNIFTNPPYKNVEKYTENFLNRVEIGKHVILFVKLQFLEGQKRKDIFKQYPPKYIYICSKRQQIARNGDFEQYNQASNSMAFCWVIWEKGYKGESVVRWI